jgi:hypothetical protein
MLLRVELGALYANAAQMQVRVAMWICELLSRRARRAVSPRGSRKWKRSCNKPQQTSRNGYPHLELSTEKNIKYCFFKIDYASFVQRKACPRQETRLESGRRP